MRSRVFFVALVLAVCWLPAAASAATPSWFPAWDSWYRGDGAYRCLPFRSPSTRPAGVPKRIPQAVWRLLRAEVAAGAPVRPGCTPPPPIPPPVLPPVPDPTPPPAAGLSPDEQTIVSTSNMERALEGLPPLAVDMRLVAASRDKTSANARTGSLDHNYVDASGAYVPFGTWMQRWCPNVAAGENIAFGYSAATVSNAWVHHPGHRENLLSTTWRFIGASALNAGGTTWTAEDFAAAPCS